MKMVTHDFTRRNTYSGGLSPTHLGKITSEKKDHFAKRYKRICETTTYVDISTIVSDQKTALPVMSHLNPSQDVWTRPLFHPFSKRKSDPPWKWMAGNADFHGLLLLLLGRGSKTSILQLPHQKPKSTSGHTFPAPIPPRCRNLFNPPLQRLQRQLPSRELTYPTLGKGKSSSKSHFWGIC